MLHSRFAVAIPIPPLLTTDDALLPWRQIPPQQELPSAFYKISECICPFSFGCAAPFFTVFSFAPQATGRSARRAGFCLSSGLCCLLIADRRANRGSRHDGVPPSLSLVGTQWRANPSRLSSLGCPLLLGYVPAASALGVHAGLCHTVGSGRLPERAAFSLRGAVFQHPCRIRSALSCPVFFTTVLFSG